MRSKLDGWLKESKSDSINKKVVVISPGIGILVTMLSAVMVCLQLHALVTLAVFGLGVWFCSIGFIRAIGLNSMSWILINFCSILMCISIFFLSFQLAAEIML
jgi:hypothetical protein